MNRYLVWLKSGRTKTVLARSETEVWFRYTTARHVKLIGTARMDAQRSAVKLARELQLSEVDSSPLSG